MAYAFAKFEIAASENVHLQENTYLTIGIDLGIMVKVKGQNMYFLGIKVTRNVAQYPLHHATYAHAQFEVGKSNGLGEDTITRNVMDGHTDFGAKLI